MKYYIYIENEKYFLGIPKEGIVNLYLEEKNLEGEKEKKISEIKEIYSISSNYKERVISKQQWLLEIDAMNETNEWEINSLYLYLFICGASIISILSFFWLGLYTTFWIPILSFFLILFSFICVKKTKNKIYNVFILIGFVFVVMFLFFI